jgi:pilus assembly protein Flp/PilA
MKTMIQKFFREEEGATAVEYGLLVALIAVAIVGTVTALGTSLSGLFGSVDGTIGSAGGGS